MAFYPGLSHENYRKLTIPQYSALVRHYEGVRKAEAEAAASLRRRRRRK